MKIGVIGSGNVGGTLGVRLAKKGHDVTFGSRNTDSPEIQNLLKAGGKSKAASLPDTAHSNDVLLLATPWAATEQIVRSLGDLTGKIVIDATNPLLPDLSGLALGTTTSAAEQVAQWAAGAKVVKAFNTVGFNIMENPYFRQGRPVMFFCGDDAGAKGTVKTLVDELGFEGVDAGPLAQARVLEPFALLWISLALKSGLGREIGFQLLQR